MPIISPPASGYRIGWRQSHKPSSNSYNSADCTERKHSPSKHESSSFKFQKFKFFTKHVDMLQLNASVGAQTTGSGFANRAWIGGEGDSELRGSVDYHSFWTYHASLVMYLLLRQLHNFAQFVGSHSFLFSRKPLAGILVDSNFNWLFSRSLNIAFFSGETVVFKSG